MNDRKPGALHGGHRERLREKFRVGGAAALNPHERLELLLFYVIPRRDTNELAHRLLARFGTLDGIIDAPAELLRQVEGMGAGGAEFFRLLHDLYPEYAAGHREPKRIIDKPARAADEFFDIYSRSASEELALLVLGENFRLLYGGTVSDGGHIAVDISLRRIAHTALAYDCAFIILGHNHPSGLPSPSPEDVSATAAAETALEGLGIKLLDHIIVSGKSYVSFSERGFMLGQKQLWRGNNAASRFAAYNKDQ